MNHLSVMTLKASPLNSRGCTAPPERSIGCDIDPEGVARAHGRPPNMLLGHPFRVLVAGISLSAGPLDTAAIERRRFQRLLTKAVTRVGNFNKLKQ